MSLERIQDFLLLEEMNEVKITHNEENGIYLIFYLLYSYCKNYRHTAASQ